MEVSVEVNASVAGKVQTQSPLFIELIDDFINSASALFADNCVSIYIMGSLSRGGFSEFASDIDLGIILTKVNSDTAAHIDSLVKTIRSNHPSINNNLSVFWGSVESINGDADGGRYPPFDRLDLIEHATLLLGKEVRDQLKLPTQKELEVSCVEFALEKLATSERTQEFCDCQRIADKGVVYVTKTILFPARFIYLLKSGVIAGNQESADYYVTNYLLGPDAILVNKGYEWRVNGFPERIDEVAECLQIGLVPLYVRFIDLYVDVVRNYGRDDLVQQLQSWKQKIELTRF
ncbi:hypothetical protein [Sessilibacter corallicola]|uniref:hypothetical protein n=1 Tax=Sessilibacter corallicola TaxID=2904075 RepID=UPI001E4A1056|nr:hypothetical protein [Sessilibacter corallicola]MCE2027811.1 hypothetical protein [Sessilibacter corallicola]